MLKHYIARFWARNLTTYRVLFCIPPRSKNFSPSDCTRTVTLLARPSIHFKSPWIGWKAIYVETLYSKFLSAKFDKVSTTFFVYHLGQKCSPAQTVLGQWHSSLDPQLIWIILWRGWKRFMLKHYIARFWARNLTTYRVLFCIPPRSKNLSPSDCTRTVTLLPRPLIHFKSPWIGWKAIYVETLYSALLSAKIDNVSSNFFIPPKSKLFPLRLHTGSDTPPKTLNSFE